MSPSPYVVRQDAVTPYSPLNHEATVNRRLVGRDNVGARRLEVGDDYVDEVGPGDTVFFPAGAPHVFTTISEAPVKVLVIYAPPYAETGAVRHATPHPAPARRAARGSNVTRRAR